MRKQTLDTRLLVGTHIGKHVITSSMRNNTEDATIKYLKDAPKDVLKHFNIGDDYSFDELCRFEYHFNNYGFRSNEDFHLDNEPNEAWCFGCSHTEGLGLPLQHTWPYLLQKETSMKVKNFGVSGSGGETAWRLIRNWVENSTYKPEHIYILGFHHPRIEVLYTDEIYEGGYKWVQVNASTKEAMTKDLDKPLLEIIDKKWNEIVYEDIPKEETIIKEFLDKHEIKYSIINPEVLFKSRIKKYTNQPYMSLDLGRDIANFEAFEDLMTNGYIKGKTQTGAHPGLYFQKEVVKRLTDMGSVL